MLQLTAHIKITGAKTWEFDKVESIEIERDIDKLTDICTLRLPKKVKWNNDKKIPIHRGDKIAVDLGYNGDNVPAFRGYVTQVGVKSPIEILCEDEMFILKQTPCVKKAYAQGSIEEILKDQQLKCDVKVMGAEKLGAYRVDTEVVTELLAVWKEQGIRSFFKYDANDKPTLYCGVIFEHAGRVMTFNNRLNMISDSSLEQQTAADIKIKIKATSIDAKNKRTKVEVGDPEGAVRTIHAYNMSEADLKAKAKAELERLKVDGLTGTFTTFGTNPLIDKLDLIGIVIDNERMGEYEVDANKITYNNGGLRQEIKLGLPVTK